MAKKKSKHSSKPKREVSIFYKSVSRTDKSIIKFKKLSKIGFSFVAEKLFSNRNAEVEITFCKDPFIKELNKIHRKKNKPTDVLSFPTDFLNDQFTQSLGDIVISVDTARMQAKERGISFLEEIIRLYHHGLLHLLGFDHENVRPKDRAKMKRWEVRLWKLIK